MEIVTDYLDGVRDAMECCRQIVRSFGPATLSQNDRDALIVMIDHYEKLAVKDEKVKS